MALYEKGLVAQQFDKLKERLEMPLVIAESLGHLRKLHKDWLTKYSPTARARRRAIDDPLERDFIDQHPVTALRFFARIRRGTIDQPKNYEIFGGHVGRRSLHNKTINALQTAFPDRYAKSTGRVRHASA